jgi:hypothetical protein
MLSILLAALMQAQPAAAVQQIEGAITLSDPGANGEHYDAYSVEMRGGQRVAISVLPRGSTVFGLSVHSRDGAQTLAASGGMQMAFTPRADGVYLVRVASDRTGGYTLRVADSGR